MSRHGFSSVIRFVTQNICIKPNGIAELDKSNNKVEIIDLTSRKEKEYKNKMLQTVNWNSAWRLLNAHITVFMHEELGKIWETKSFMRLFEINSQTVYPPHGWSDDTAKWKFPFKEIRLSCCVFRCSFVGFQYYSSKKLNWYRLPFSLNCKFFVVEVVHT